MPDKICEVKEMTLRHLNVAIFFFYTETNIILHLKMKIH